MDLNEVYKCAEENHIDVLSFITHNKKAFCIDDGTVQLIAMDYTKIDTEIEKKEILAAEISHLKYKLLYFLTDYHNPNFAANVRKAETKAKRRAAEMLIPLRELQQVLTQTTNLWELAEIFDTSETTVRIALDHYRRKNLI